MWKYCEICCISTIIYIKEKKSINGRLKKKNVAIVQNSKKKKKEDKVANQNGTVDEQWKILYEPCKNTREKRAQINDWEKIKSDKQYILNKSKIL